jgi:hypothetical protein
VGVALFIPLLPIALVGLAVWALVRLASPSVRPI